MQYDVILWKFSTEVALQMCKHRFIYMAALNL